MRHVGYTIRIIFAIVVFGIYTTGTPTHAQSLEPREFANAPVGMNFLLVSYQYSEGALLFDPSLPIDDAHAQVDMALLAYVRTLGVADKSAKAGMLLPYAELSANGYVNGQYRTRNTTGIADPTFLFTVNLLGAPALSLQEFKDYRQSTIVGFSFKLTAPWGVYEEDKLLNIGTNRWSFEPKFGISHAIQRWRLEAAAGATFYTENDSFDGDKTRRQKPIYSLQGHVVYSFRKAIWAAVSATYYTGGQTTIDGEARNDLQNNWRMGFTFALPINRHNSVKIYGNSGVSTRTGTDYDSLGLAWQYRWM